MKSDLISRKEAIDAFDPENPRDWYTPWIIETLEELPSAEPEYPTDVEEILDYLDNVLHPILSPENWNVYSELHDMVANMPAAQPERTCVNCGRTVNNGGWYADGRTRCPIEEHYALPKDGYCHLWEKRNVTDDDYPERRTDE